MTMSVASLAKELEAMIPVMTEAEGISNFAQAFENYFYEAEVAFTPANPGTLAPCTAAMRSAMVGISGVGAPSITAGIAAFWGALSGIAVLVWTLAPPLASTTPAPGLAGITAAVEVVVRQNIKGEVSIEQAAYNMAAAIHPLNLGGLAVNTVVPTPVSFPIL